MLYKSQKSFTFIELLVTIAIIGLVSSIIVVAIHGARAAARDAKRQVELDQIQKGLEFYYIAKDEYPVATSWISLEADDDTGGSFSQTMKPDYLSAIPRDPLYPKEYEAGKKYAYWYRATTPKSYELYVKREQGGFFKISSEKPGLIVYSAEGPDWRTGRFWVGGTGNWSDTSRWSTGSGGSGGVSKPTSLDNCYFDINSGGGTATVDEVANCKDLDFTGYTGTFAGSSALNIYGSLKMAAGMTRTYTGAITFAATSMGKTLTFNGKVMASATTFNGVGGGWIVQDTWNNGSSAITLTNGNLNTNGQIITCGTFSSSNSNLRTLTLGASTINCTGWTLTTVTNLTFDAGTSVIRVTGTGAFSGGGKAYNEVQLNGTAHTVSGANTFVTLTRTGTATRTDYVSFSANQTITGTLTLAGNSSINRLLVYSSVIGTPRTLTVATVSVSNANFQDITGAGSGNWDLSAITGFSGDCGGNSGITFTPAQNHYWVGNGGSWSSTARWSTSSGGASGARVPLPQDDCFIDANSITLSGQTITADMPRLGRNINFTGVLNNPTLSQSTSSTIFGSLALASGMSRAGGYYFYFYGRGSHTITTAGITLYGFFIYAYGGTYTAQDDITWNSTLTSYLYSGTFDANNKNLTGGLFYGSGSYTRTLNMGSGTWTLTGSGTVWDMTTVTNLTLNANTSTIKLTNNSSTNKTFAGGGRTYYNFWNATAGTGIVIITGSNTFNDFRIDAGRTQQFTAGTTQTVTTFTASGSAGNLITIGSATAASHTLTKAGGGTISCDYLSISYSAATPANTWYAGANSTNGGNNSGWIFTPPP